MFPGKLQKETSSAGKQDGAVRLALVKQKLLPRQMTRINLQALGYRSSPLYYIYMTQCTLLPDGRNHEPEALRYT